MIYDIGDPLEVLTVSRRFKQPEWIPATVWFVGDGLVEVIYEGGSKERFPVDTGRLRKAGAVEGAQWVF